MATIKLLDHDRIDSSEGRSFRPNKVPSWTRYASVASVAPVVLVIFLVIEILCLALPITALAIGIRYRDPRYCPIEPRISLFLIVQGSVSLISNAVYILILLLGILSAVKRSVVGGVLTLVLLLIVILIGTFSLIWLIIGSVWTFSVQKRGVQHQYDTQNNFYPYTYCQPVLYQFAFAFLIISFVLLILPCITSCCSGRFSRKK